MHDQHILSLEGFFLPRAFLPTANKALLVGMYMIVVDMFHKIVLVYRKISQINIDKNEYIFY
jgi:hypothetical protein